MSIKKPSGYEIFGEEHKVYKLKKALYGLKQAPRAWYKRIDSYFVNNGFSKSVYEPTLYIKVCNEGEILIVYLFVDDMIFTGNMSFNNFKASMIVLPIYLSLLLVT